MKIYLGILIYKKKYLSNIENIGFNIVYDYDGYLYNMAIKAGIRTTINLDIEHFDAEYDLDSMKTAHEYIRTRDNTIFNKEFNRVLNIIKKV